MCDHRPEAARIDKYVSHYAFNPCEHQRRHIDHVVQFDRVDARCLGRSRIEEEPVRAARQLGGKDGLRGAVLSERELRQLLRDVSVVQIGLVGEGVAQTHAVVEDAESDRHLAVQVLGLAQPHD